MQLVGFGPSLFDVGGGDWRLVLVSLFRSKVRLAEQVRALQLENKDLRTRLDGSHRARQSAVAEAAELRSQKERLREKLVELKKEMANQKRLLELAHERNSALQAEVDALQ